MDSISVGQLNAYLRKVIQAQDGLRNVCVFGEVSGFKYSGAHAYFTLKDAEGAISCSLFNARKTYNPVKEGESVLCTGSIDYYAKTGRLSLIVNTMQPVGQGKLHVLLEQLKAKLQQEGLFDPAHKKAIPRFPAKVCVVTSKTGAVIRDIVRTVRKTNEVLDIDVYDVRVQGEYAAAEMCAALSLVDALGYDCIILARGGGSFEDLMPFNDEALARVIYAMDTPIISAVGHETDFSISDFVADARAATPTAAAVMVAYDTQAWSRQIATDMQRAYSRLSEKLAYRTTRVHAFTTGLNDKMLRKLDGAQKDVLALSGRLSASMDALCTAKEVKLEKATALLSAANPARLLQKGFCRIGKEGRNLDYDDIAIGDHIDVTAAKGVLSCVVEGKTPAKTGE